MFRTVQIVITNNIFSSWVATSGGIILLWFGSTLVINREISIGQLLAFNSLNAQIIALVNTVVGFVTEFTRAQADFKSIQANLKSAEAAYKAAIVKRDRYQIIAQSGLISQNQLEEVQLAATQQAQILESQKAILESQIQVIQQKQQALTAAIARRAKAASVLNPSNAVIEIAQEKIATEQASKQNNLARLRQEKVLYSSRYGSHNRHPSSRRNFINIHSQKN